MSVGVPQHARVPFKALAFDWGHTVMDEQRDADVPLGRRPVHLMPGVRDVLPALTLPLALWANTRYAAAPDLRRWLRRAELDACFRWVVTSVDAGVRKPAPGFFGFALARCGLTAADVLFIGNQRNTDIAGAAAAGIQSVWLSSPAHRSPDDRNCDAMATHVIDGLPELPALLARLGIR